MNMPFEACFLSSGTKRNRSRTLEQNALLPATGLTGAGLLHGKLIKKSKACRRFRLQFESSWCISYANDDA